MRRSLLLLPFALLAASLAAPGTPGQAVAPKDSTKDAAKAAPKAAAKGSPKGEPKAKSAVTEGFVRFRAQEIDRSLKVGYCVLVVDINGDSKPDIVVADTDRVVWYENPGAAGQEWKRRTMIESPALNRCHDVEEPPS